MLFHLFEYLLHGVEHDARVLLITEHRVCLSCTCLSISKDGRVISIKDSLTQKLSRILEHFQLFGVFFKSIIECILLFFGSIFAKYLILMQYICWVHQYYDVLIEDLDNADLALVLLLLPHWSQTDGHL